MTIFLHCLFCAAAEMTVEWKRQSDVRRCGAFLPGLSFWTVFAYPNDRGAVRRSCHFERGCLPIWSQKYIYSIETLSREISHTNGTRTSGGRFLHFTLLRSK